MHLKARLINSAFQVTLLLRMMQTEKNLLMIPTILNLNLTMFQIKIAIKYRPYCMIQLKTHSLSLLIRNSHHQPKTYPKYYQRIRNFQLKIQNKYPQRIKNNCSLQKTLNKHRLKILLLNLYILSLKKMVLANYLVKFKMILTKNKRKFKMARKK